MIYSKIKRAIDLVIVILFSPFIISVILILAIIVFSFIGYPVFFFQRRIGLKGKEFNLIKFRTMTNERDKFGELLSDELRLTSLGAFLRSSSLDEIPCLVNVFLGQMSLVGPRPFITKYRNLYTDEQFKRHNVMPGITGLAQINGRNAISWDEKFTYDLQYVNRQSFWLDVKILFLTVANVLRRKGISADGHVTMEEFKGSNSKS